MASAVIIILMALITCGFTTKIKYNKILEAEREKRKNSCRHIPCGFP